MAATFRATSLRSLRTLRLRGRMPTTGTGGACSVMRPLSADDPCDHGDRDDHAQQVDGLGGSDTEDAVRDRVREDVVVDRGARVAGSACGQGEDQAEEPEEDAE